MKIATNLNLAVQMMAFCEAVLLAEKSGISRGVAVDVLTNSAIASPMIKYRGPFVLGMPNEPLFEVNMMQKDIMLALDTPLGEWDWLRMIFRSSLTCSPKCRESIASLASSANKRGQ